MASKIGKILVVDDNLGIRRALEILLPVHFAEVKTIPSPATLVSSLEQFALDTPLCIRIRKKVFPGKVVKKRFYQTNYKK